MIRIELDGPLDARLTRLAAVTGQTKTTLVKEALEKHLGDLEDIYAAREVLERVRSGKEPVHSAEDVEKLLSA